MSSFFGIYGSSTTSTISFLRQKCLMRRVERYLHAKLREMRIGHKYLLLGVHLLLLLLATP